MSFSPESSLRPEQRPDRLDELLAAFFAGQQWLQPTIDALEKHIQASPASAARLLEIVDERRRGGRLPPEVARELAAPAQAAAPPAAALQAAIPQPSLPQAAAIQAAPALDEATQPYPGPAPSMVAAVMPAAIPVALPAPLSGPAPAVPPAPRAFALPLPTPMATPMAAAPREGDAAAVADAANLGALIDRFRNIQSAKPRAAPGGDVALDAALSNWRGLRDRARAGRAAGAPASPTRAPTGPAQPARPGRIIKERFVLDRLLGQGGMGEVWRAVDRRRLEAGQAEPYVALKLLPASLRSNIQALRALEGEARRGQSLSHPNIVNIFDFDRDGDAVFVAMECLEGRTLTAEIAALGARGAEEPAVRGLIGAMCGALAHAHSKGVVHYDFKPANVFVCGNGEVKVLDFGIARALREPPGEAAAELSLTPAYASAEMLEGQPPDPRDDVYGLACTVYAVLTTRHPYDRRPATEARTAGMKLLRPDGLARAPWAALERGLALRRAERLETPLALAEAFSAARPRLGLFGSW